MREHQIKIAGEDLKLLSQKAIYWDKQNMLILSDIHLGKAGHFRKHGIPISKSIHNDDLKRLQNLISSKKPEKVVIVGDLFHSYQNNEWIDFEQFISINDHVTFHLVKGNHDIMPLDSNLLKISNYLDLDPFHISHEQESTNLFNIFGHIHPGVRVNGKARQSMVIPCFLFTDKFGILPSFGGFTGIKKIIPKKLDQVFGVINDTIIELS